MRRLTSRPSVQPKVTNAFACLHVSLSDWAKTNACLARSPPCFECPKKLTEDANSRSPSTSPCLLPQALYSSKHSWAAERAAASCWFQCKSQPCVHNAFALARGYTVDSGFCKNLFSQTVPSRESKLYQKY